MFLIKLSTTLGVRQKIEQSTLVYEGKKVFVEPWKVIPVIRRISINQLYQYIRNFTDYNKSFILVLSVVSVI